MTDNLDAFVRSLVYAAALVLVFVLFVTLLWRLVMRVRRIWKG